MESETAPKFVTTSVAAWMLGFKNGQTVRNYMAVGKLDGEMGKKPWKVSLASVEAYLVKFGRYGEKPADTSGPAGVASEQDELERRILGLEREVLELRAALHQRAGERDRLRAEAADLQAAALRLSGATREASAALGQALGELAEAQAETLTVLLSPRTAPGSGE